jgi:cytochrome P450
MTWLNPQAVDSYSNVLDMEATDMLHTLYNDSRNGRHINPQTYAGRCSLNNMLTITFGFRTDNIHHPMVAEALRLSRAFMNCTGPMSNLVDFVPVLQLLSLPLERKAKALHKDLVKTYGGLINQMDGRMKNGEDVPNCLAKTMLDVKDDENLDHIDMSIMASAFMIGGVETTASIMQWFMALIPAHPHIQKRAQEELDRVVGRDRLPTVADEINLPYCHAIIKEVERCHNPFWLGTPHTTMQDVVYKGKVIPKDTVVVLNTWSMHHSEKKWERPYEFNVSPNRTHTLHISQN